MERSRARGTNRKVRGERRRRRSRKKKKKEKKEIIFKTPRREVDLETSRPRPLRFRVWCVVVPFFFLQNLSLSLFLPSLLSLSIYHFFWNLFTVEKEERGGRKKRERERERESLFLFFSVFRPPSLSSLSSLFSLTTSPPLHPNIFIKASESPPRRSASSRIRTHPGPGRSR